MKVCAAQTRPASGNIAANIEAHYHFIDRAAAELADFVLFSELSLTGYEPTLAAKLAMTCDDARLDGFQIKSDAGNITIGVGLPTLHDAGVCISTIFFQPRAARCIYSKAHLHRDELPYIQRGSPPPTIAVRGHKIAPAICYEISVRAHAAAAAAEGACLYAASVAKTAEGMEVANVRLPEIAAEHNMPALLANAVGAADGCTCGGQTAVWDATGRKIAGLNSSETGILIYDTELSHANSIFL